MKLWCWLVLELLVMFGTIAWVYFSPSETFEEDCCRALLGYVVIFSVENIRKYFKEN